MLILNKKNIIKNGIPAITNKSFIKAFSLVVYLFFLSYSISYSQQAVISGDTTICYGGGVDIHLSLEGTAPWNVTIQLNYSTNYNYSNIYQQDTILRFEGKGDFRIISASDNNGVITFNPNTVVKANYFLPLTEARMSGEVSICEGSSYNAKLELNGNTPWNIAYTYNGIDTTEVTNILSSPRDLNFSKEGTYTLISVNDNNCPGTAIGTFTLSFHEKPTATLSVTRNGYKCTEKTTPLMVELAGSPPYELDYLLNGQTITSFTNLTNSYFEYEVKDTGIYKIQFTDVNGCAGYSNDSVEVSNYELQSEIVVNLNNTYAENSPPVILEAEPSGGEFDGDGVFGDKFYPSIAKQLGSEPYNIIYIYEDPTTQCYYYDTTTVEIIDSIATIIFPEDRERFCSNEDTIIVRGANLYNSIGTFTISGKNHLENIGNDSAFLYPSKLLPGSYTITYTYNSGSSNDNVSRDIEIVEVDPVWITDPDAREFCGNDERIELIGSETGGIFNGPGVETDTIEEIKYFFNPENANVGDNNIVYSYKASNGCISKTTELFNVNGVPIVKFSVLDSCVNENTPKPIKFIDETVSVDEIDKWDWNFGDFGDNLTNTSNEKNPSHIYDIADVYNVALTVTTVAECIATGKQKISFGESPLSGFVFSSECFNPDTSILFVQSVPSKYDIINSEWHFDESIRTGDSVYYEFPKRDEYLVKLIVKTSEGCVDTFAESIQLKPTISLSDGSYRQDFEIPNHWENEYSKALNNNSWIFGATDNNYTQTANNKAWYTLLDYSGEESSWIKSPCFDFTNVERPYVSFDLWRDFEEARDGANFQYTLDNGNTWNLVGTVNDGTNWYNSYQISGNPGGHDEGWSENLKDNHWVTVKHRLDELAGKINVQFRLVYGSDGTNNENNGIAFDNVYISERNHVVLLEHFTNSSSTTSLSDDSLINVLRLKNINDLIDIQYHTDFPGTDPLNLVNPLEVNARLLYYGYSSVPLSIMDGINTYDFTTNSVTHSDIIKKSLNESEFEINFEATSADNNLNIDYSIKSLNIQSGRDLFLYIVILEDSIKNVIDGKEIIFMNTFRSFVPDPGGISLPSDWGKNEIFTDEVNWEIENVENIENMKVALFLQDGQSNSVIQSAINRKLQPVSIRNNGSNQLNKINVYPNPFSSTLHISRGSIDGVLKLDLYSISGNLLSSSILGRNESIIELNSRTSSGLYFLRITEIETGYSETIRVVKN